MDGMALILPASLGTSVDGLIAGATSPDTLYILNQTNFPPIIALNTRYVVLEEKTLGGSMGHFFPATLPSGCASTVRTVSNVPFPIKVIVKPGVSFCLFEDW
jgi:hypothetical protein